MIRNLWDEISETVIEQAALKALGLSGLNMTVEDCHPVDTACVQRNGARARVRQCEGIVSSSAYLKAQCENNERLNHFRFDLHCEKFDPIACPTFAEALAQVLAGAPNTRTVTGEDVFEARDRVFQTAIAEPDRPAFVSPQEQPRPAVAAPPPPAQEIMCTAEVKICPDGSTVARQGPDCEFAPCPALAPGDEENGEEADGGFKFEWPKALTGQPWYVYAIAAAALMFLLKK